MANIEFLARAVAAFRKTGDTKMVAYAADRLVELAPTTGELIREAGNLNNTAKLVNTDHVSIMGLMDHAEMVLHVAKLRDLAA